MGSTAHPPESYVGFAEDVANPLGPVARAQHDNEPVLLPSVAAIAAADEAFAAAERRSLSQAKLPFNNSRLLSYQQRVNGRVNDTLEFQQNRSYDSEGFVPDYLPRSSGSLNQLGTQGSRASSRNGLPPDPSGGLPPVVNQDMYMSAVSELHGIRSEIARVENVLGSLKEPVERTTLGRPIIRKAQPPPRKAHRNDTFDVRKKEWEAAKEFNHNIPVSRGEAIILEKTLEELLPAGMVTAALRTGKRGTPGFDVHLFEKQYELVDMVLREAARQVQVGCHERGSVLEKLRIRYNEFFAAMKTLLFKLQQNYTLASTDVKELQTQVTTLTKEQDDLKHDNVRLKSEEEYLQQRLETSELESKQYRETTNETIQNLKADNQLLEQELAHYEERLASASHDREDAVNNAVQGLEETLAAMADERDDLTQRIRFLERQLTKAREERGRAVSWDHAATQTEAEMGGENKESGASSSETSDTSEGEEETGAGEREAEIEEEEEDLSEEEGEDEGTQAQAGKASGDVEVKGRAASRKMRRKKRQHQARKQAAKEAKQKGEPDPARVALLGGFLPLVRSDRVGRIKPRGQILKIIAQIYTEKIVVDQVDDRERNPRVSLPVFVYDWHLNRYGLRNLAEMNLMDMIASTRHWAGSSLKVKLFGQFCGVVRSDHSTLEHLNFYLYCMQVLSANVALLFPELEDAVFWLKPLRVLDVVRAVFPAFGDAATLRQFMASKVEPLMDNRTKMYDADKVLYMLLEEWQRRAERNTAQLKALFRAGDSDADGLLTYDEFLSVVRLADGLRSEREIVRMYREALLLSPDGETIDPESFVRVARQHGLSTWKIDYRVSGNTTAAPSDEHQHDESLYSMLDNVLETTEDLDEQIAALNSKIGEDHELMRKISKQYAYFQQKYRERDDADGTWLAFRMVVGEIRAALVRYRGGMRKMAGAVKNSLNVVARGEARPNSTYTSPLIAMLQQSKDEEGGAGVAGLGGGEEPSALNMMKGAGIDD
mmetsp:Transcript_27238/g.59485  ORF Transcript_27238/g.59485 Transcript_27238/m.59485 type:complete len:1001 (-) Transcript_27238:277-3279(-)|eukprot:CAMPEP_0118957422 /NCGR_PEP_ID=MMETSP1169-20130426/62099_1 /TAXON_ID=36882 /ORGANISM="Pyramimonas obovata, Strain CCMP722" /LENGTH=1000 /DNA_ID=CAMNT_0006905505 /DNA_START=53 /DNA_END=3055 /DNA_ORIENTATION=+